MRYSRHCDECIRLAADTAALFQEYLDAKDALTMTAKNDAAYVQRRKHLDKVTGQLTEAQKRQDYHDKMHHPEDR